MCIHARLARAAAGASCAVLAACGTTPYSQLVGARYYQAPIDTYPVTVTRVDDRDYALLPVYIEPGSHQVTVQGPPTGGFPRGETRTFTLDVKACTRYYLVAQKPNRLSQDFAVKVDHEEPVPGCRVG